MGHITSSTIAGKRVAFLAGRGVEQVELTEPWEAVERAGGQPLLVSPEDGQVTAMRHDWEHGASFRVDVPLSEARADDFDALVLPGGTLNADRMRLEKEGVALVKAFSEAGKPIAAICHGPWILIEAGVAKGRRMTSYASLETDLRNAGADWVDEEVVTDRGLTTSRNPGDLEPFCSRLLEEVAEGRRT